MAFSEKQIQEVWDRAMVVDGYDKSRFRKDACGAWIIRNKYGDTDSQYGWVIDHVVPQALLEDKGFSEDEIDAPVNLRAMQHENNESKSDDYPSYTAVVTSNNTVNIRLTRFLEVNQKKQDTLNQLYDL
jgi:hypothetical protein